MREADTGAVCEMPIEIQSVIKVVYGHGGVCLPGSGVFWELLEFSGSSWFDSTTGAQINHEIFKCGRMQVVYLSSTGQPCSLIIL